MREMSSRSAATRRRLGEAAESSTSAKRTRGVLADESAVSEGVIEEGSRPGGGDKRDADVPAASAGTLADLVVREPTDPFLEMHISERERRGGAARGSAESPDVFDRSLSPVGSRAFSLGCATTPSSPSS